MSIVKNILRFQVSMADVLLVKEFYTVQELINYLFELLLTLKLEFLQRWVIDILHDNRTEFFSHVDV